jgi:pyridoxal phosphate enzyme (YggS family)
MIDIEANIASVRETINRACETVNRNPDTVTLITVTKEQPIDYILQAIELGERHFGESRLPEAREKIELIEDERLNWHMLGNVPHGQLRYIPRLFATFQAVDDLANLAYLSDFTLKGQLQPSSVLIEVNISGEATKRGLQAYNWENDAEIFKRLVAQFQTFYQHKGVKVEGMMTLAPYADNLESIRPFFRSMARLREVLQEQLGEPLPHLSMGMTNDYRVAIEEGATFVRVGRAIFGERSS